MHNATAFGLSCPQQASTLPIPNGLPEATLAYLKLSSANGTIRDGEDCEEAIVEAPNHTGSNSDNGHRFDSQCRCTTPGPTGFKTPSFSGMYSG